jgi:hypothetical protein
MQDFNTVSGQIIEIRRYVTPLDPYGQGTRRERWELWIKTPVGTEQKLVAESRSMQARRGHRVVIALDCGAPVGMVNLTTKARTNFALSDPPLLYRPMDVTVAVALLFVSLFAATLLGPQLFLLAVPLALLYIPFIVMARWFSRRAAQHRAEAMLDQIERDAASPTGRAWP